MADWAADVGALLDGLGLDRISVIALSGGASFGLAAAHGQPDRVIHLTLVAPAWIPDDRSTRGMAWINRVLWWCARHARPLFALFVGRLMPAAMADPDRSIAAGFPEVDQRAFADNPQIEARIKAAFREAIQAGPAGVVDDGESSRCPHPPSSLGRSRSR